MADNPITEYQAKRKELREAKNNIQNIVRIVLKGAEELKTFQEMFVTGIAGYPAPLEMTRTPTVNKADAWLDAWPTGKQIKELLAQWHALAREARQAYERIPQDQREGIQSPGSQFDT